MNLFAVVSELWVYDIIYFMKKMVIKSQLKSREMFERRAQSIGLEFSNPVWQHERIYWPRDYRQGMNLPRMVLRTEVSKTDEPARYSLFLKRHIEDSGVDIVHETAVENYTEATAIIHQLGFEKAAEVSRQRQSVELDRQTVIFLDIVEGLEGTFVKIETELLEDTPVEAVRQEIFDMLGLFKQETFLLQTYADILNGVLQPYTLPTV